MSFLSSINISGSALTAQKLRMQITAQNLANADSVAVDGTPYRRKVVTLSERQKVDFNSTLTTALEKSNSLAGVEVKSITEDDSVVFEFDPDHPAADENGYVTKPAIDTTEEMVEMMAASRAYEANVTMFNAVKNMASKALEIGR